MTHAPHPPLPPEAEAGPLRVLEPMAVHWQGVEYPVRDWNARGFTLATPFPRVTAPGRGRVADLTLLIGGGVTRIEMRVQARAVDTSDPTPDSYVFVDLERSQAETLHRIVDYVVADQAMSLTRLLDETEDSRTQRHETSARFARIRLVAQMVLAALVLTFAVNMAYSRFTTVTPRYAAVTTGATMIAAPAAGAVGEWLVAPGDMVQPGDVLGVMRPANLDRELAAIDLRRRVLVAEGERISTRRRELQGLADSAVAETAQLRVSLTEQRRLALAQVQLERNQLANMRTFGLSQAEITRQRRDQESRLMAAQSRLTEIDVQIERQRVLELLAPLGVQQADLRENVLTLDTVDHRLQAIADELAALMREEIVLREGQFLRAPCACRVHRLLLRPGEWAEGAARMAVLVSTEAPVVHALIPAEAARHVALGDPVRMVLADGAQARGRIARLNYDPIWPGYAGLPESVFSAERYARVEITPETELTADVGMVAEVQIRTSRILATLRSVAGVWQ